MTAFQVLRRTGILAVAVLLAIGINMKSGSAQDSNKPTPHAENVEKKKAAEKKTAPKQADTTQKNSAAPMSGFRPDPFTNY